MRIIGCLLLCLISATAYGDNIVADFAATPTSGAAPLQVQFTDLSTPAADIGILYWSFKYAGIGTFCDIWVPYGSDQDPLQTFTFPGVYDIQLLVYGRPGDNPGDDIKSEYIVASFPDFLLPAVGSWSASLLAGCGMVDGYPDGTYQPSNPVTRDQMAVYMARGLTLIESGVASIPLGTPPPIFSDVSTANWAYDAIQYCGDNGITYGFPDGTYRPTLTVTRDQMAVYIVNASTVSGLHYQPISAPPVFSDVPTDNWAYPYIWIAGSYGFVKGYPDGTYRPTDPVTRDQMAVYVSRVFLPGEATE